MPDMDTLSLAGISHLLCSGEISSRELIQYCLDRIRDIDEKLHAFLYLAPEKALRAADQADQQLVRWRKAKSFSLPPLLGVPVAIKDVLCVTGMPCTCGSRILENFIPPFNATVVERLLSAGAIILGKTNTDEFAMGSSTENSAYGTTHNPWDLACVPGGSSGGSAAAIAARLVPIALGTDTGGSVRQPASFCGVTGIKPTYGRVSRYGLVAYGSSLDVAGVLGRSAQDVATVLSLIAGKDPRDATTVATPVSPILFTENAGLSNIRIGIPDEYFMGGIQPEVEKMVRQAICTMQDLGATLHQISLPHTAFAVPVYYLIAPAEASANLARYDGVRFGPRVADDTILNVFLQTRGKKFGAEVKRRIMLGTYGLSAGYYEAYYGQAQKVRTLIKNDFEQAFSQVDVIAAPVAPTTAFRIGEHTDDPLAMYLEDIFTLPANLAGVPGLAFPVGLSDQGLPVGMQLMASHFQEPVLFKIAHAYQQVTSWHQLQPKDLSNLRSV
jgi:aspartyl-tRNA(Asn)/glutamyl-tRNA(Gln) amidotransferase subunit A